MRTTTVIIKCDVCGAQGANENVFVKVFNAESNKICNMKMDICADCHRKAYRLKARKNALTGEIAFSFGGFGGNDEGANEYGEVIVPGVVDPDPYVEPPVVIDDGLGDAVPEDAG